MSSSVLSRVASTGDGDGGIPVRATTAATARDQGLCHLAVAVSSPMPGGQSARAYATRGAAVSVGVAVGVGAAVGVSVGGCASMPVRATTAAITRDQGLRHPAVAVSSPMPGGQSARAYATRGAAVSVSVGLGVAVGVLVGVSVAGCVSMPVRATTAATTRDQGLCHPGVGIGGVAGHASMPVRVTRSAITRDQGLTCVVGRLDVSVSRLDGQSTHAHATRRVDVGVSIGVAVGVCVGDVAGHASIPVRATTAAITRDQGLRHPAVAVSSPMPGGQSARVHATRGLGVSVSVGVAVGVGMGVAVAVGHASTPVRVTTAAAMCGLSPIHPAGVIPSPTPGGPSIPTGSTRRSLG